ncbi:BLOC-1-related complex subunit 8 isoform X4 [Ambystoma mexicanum]|uniref:BLOC-1-related complex subunit 8 isoform X4 n=1 Tax=Ambystoma mexicanum TaxID=8296 RepID=UPI0037E7E348
MMHDVTRKKMGGCKRMQNDIITDKFTESMYVLANEPSVALYRLQEHVRRSLPELAQHKADMQSWEEQTQGAIYSVEYACSLASDGMFERTTGLRILADATSVPFAA